ncbi:zinc finger protein 280C [Phyllopteryx taeniolatus]|uniref:zinc finger protein 280C n=1 Tax=Phyllopteryx taeniolatus TaxID=161469 RepID=UPI002AD3D4E5|nr:zinc finger protein 280C [Phyllopteryx taeniolatus]XP_061612668.1 zinc finger protein 280C [Phyllopteryx taeniolatus]
MSELFMECEEEELEPWQRAAPEQLTEEEEEEDDDDDEPIFVGVVSKKEHEIPPVAPPPPKDNVVKHVVNSAPVPVAAPAPAPAPSAAAAPALASSIMLPLKIAGNAISTPTANLTTLTPQPVIVNNQGFIVTPQLTSNNNLIATLGKQYPPGTKFTFVPAGQPRQLFQQVTPVTTVPGVVHRPHVQQIRNNVVTLANVQSPTVYSPKHRLLQVTHATSAQTIPLPVQTNSLNRETVKRVLIPQQIDKAVKRFKADISQANATIPVENGEVKNKCPHCKEEFLQQEALNQHMTSCGARAESSAPLADVTHKRIMLVSDFYYGRFEGDCDKAPVERSSITFKCQCCLKVLKSNIRFMNHVKHHLELEKQNNESLESHTTCQHCYRMYMTPFQLQCHIESAHSPIESSTNCKICELAFESEQVLLEHMKDNHKPGEMPYVCQVCNYRSSFFSDVETHFRSVHVNTKDLLCPFCLRILRNSQRYMQHFMKHQKKGIHRCGKCRLNFLTFKDRIDHRTQVHKTFRKPSVLEGLPAGTKVTIRASLSGKMVATSGSVDRSAIIFTPETLSNSATTGWAKSKRNTSEAGKAKITPKKKGHSTTNCNLSLKSISVNGGCYTCIECNTKIDDFFSHFLVSSVCGACNYRTSCKVAIGNHMIRFHSTVNKSRFSKADQRKHSSAMKLTLVCLNCDLLVDASGGDVMSKHINDRPNHVCKVIEEKGVKAETGVQDQSDALRMKRKELLPKLKEARERGEMAILRHDKLIFLTPATAHQNNTETSVDSSKPCTVLKSAPMETTLQIEEMEHLPQVSVEQPQSAPVLPATVEDSPEENTTQSAVEDSPGENVTRSAVEDSPGENAAQSAVEDSPEENATQSGSSPSHASDGVEHVKLVGDSQMTEDCDPAPAHNTD